MTRAADNGHVKAKQTLEEEFSVDITPAQLEAATPKVVAKLNYEIGLAEIMEGNVAAGLKSLREAADANHGDAQYTLARIHLDGDGVPKDLATGEAWLKRAADNGVPQAVEAMRERDASRTTAIRMQTREIPSSKKFPFALAGLTRGNEFALALFFFGPPTKPARDGSAMWFFDRGTLHVSYDASSGKITAVSAEHSGAAQALKRVNVTDPGLAFIGMRQSDVIAALGKPTRTVGEGILFWDYTANGTSITANVDCYENDNPNIDGFRKGICYSISVDWSDRH